MCNAEINEMIASLNEKQRQAFDLINSWAKKTILNFS